ncbi:Bug family tripartite tricarboxylate transporter substrate binding protein [Candidimonas nitroreducens]|uniref:ABC transporter substrate-binding protein n=1 Tax=Candidimonas nitroreducens TaxID=683354 RepID=A0A225MAY9_9BURK|nr:tripartite tricarboxylate transporter substrate binding protein [Candidimonas nitroreducens]OWT58455.1 ABC transporter substrate-binding protein [Candidimonas nitroreducens]
MRIVFRKTLAASCAALGVALAGIASAAPWPNRPVQLVVPYPPGGAGDIISRLLAKKLGEKLHQSIIVENKAGAGTIVGAQAVARAKPDGYTLLISSGTTFTMNPAVYAKLPYDPVKDFQPLGFVARAGLVVVANKQSPFTSLASLVNAARAHPGQISFGSFGVGTVSQFAAEMFMDASKIRMTHIPYKGSGPAMNDLLGGQVPVLFDTIVSSMPQIKAGKIRALAVTTAHRSAFLPEVPTIAESGYPGFNIDTWIALFGPRGLPAEVSNTLTKALAAIAADPETQKQFKASGFEPADGGPQAVADTIASETPRFMEIAKRAHIRTQ